MNKNFIPTLLICLLSNVIISQNEKISYVLYKNLIITKEQEKNNKNDENTINDERYKKIELQMTTAFEIGKNFESELFCTKTQSLFKPIDKLMNDVDPISYKIANALFRGDTNYYNLEENSHIEQTELGGEKINIIYPIDYYKWVVTNETKMIDNYKCYKATADWIDDNKIKQVKVLKKAIAWFTPEIPLRFGPNGLGGLPGLILEGSLDEVNYFYATKIILDYKDKVNIEIPKSNKTITIAEYPDLLLKNFTSNR